MTVPAPEHLSPSSWKTWDQCPARFYWKHVERVPEPTGVPAELGTFAHRVWELLYQRPTPERTITAARGIAADVWAEGTPATVADGTIGVADFKRRAWGFVLGAWDLEEPSEVQVASTEERVRFTERDVPMVCVIDRTDATDFGLSPVDYKSGKVRAEDARQIAVNGLALRSRGERVAPAGRLLYVAHERTETITLDRKALETASLSAVLTWGAILDACERDGFDPRPSPLCAWCPRVDRCDEGLAVTRRAVYTWKNPPPEDAPGVVALRAIERGSAA